jgi:hypothetical protein
MDSLNSSFESYASDVSDVMDWNIYEEDAYENSYVPAWPQPARCPKPPSTLLWAPPVKMPAPLPGYVLERNEEFKIQITNALTKKTEMDTSLLALTTQLGEVDTGANAPKWGSRNTTKQNLAKRLRIELEELTKKRDAAESEYNTLLTASTITRNLVTSHESLVAFVEDYEKTKAPYY